MALQLSMQLLAHELLQSLTTFVAILQEGMAANVNNGSTFATLLKNSLLVYKLSVPITFHILHQMDLDNQSL